MAGGNQHARSDVMWRGEGARIVKATHLLEYRLGSPKRKPKGIGEGPRIRKKKREKGEESEVSPAFLCGAGTIFEHSAGKGFPDQPRPGRGTSKRIKKEKPLADFVGY